MLDNSTLEKILNESGMHLETDCGSPVMGEWRMGPIERAEMYRAAIIDAQIEERRRRERRNFKGY